MKFEMHHPNIPSIFISIIWFSLVACSQFVAPANGGDFQALLSIKAEIPQDLYGILASWNHSSHFCNWRGVSCNNMTQQRVFGLNLSGLELRGTLSASIGNLTFLNSLNLENNLFFGSIPQEISQLYNLQHLVLSNNSFQGEIPRNFTYLSGISLIDLDRNDLTGTIPAEFGLLPNLVELHISQNSLNGTIPSSIGNLSALRVLSLSDNNLEGIIPQELGKLSTLQILQLSSNKLTGDLPLLIYNITSLQHIILDSNSLSGSLSPEHVFYLPNLQTFSVGGNKFMGSIPSSISNSSRLVIWDIGGNYLSGPIPMGLGNLKQLQRLDFSGNSIGTNNITGLNFLSSLINCSNLRVLHLNDNNHIGILPNSIVNLSTTLVSLRLDGNYISGEIPVGLERLKNLERLALSHNSLVGTIPGLIGKLIKLQGLYLSNNRFVGGIPPSIGNITLLSILEMQENLLGGDIPVSLSNCSLLALDLSHNRLTNAIPVHLFEISTLTYTLNLAHNLLSGRLPLEVSKLINLLSFDISHNNLSGELPVTVVDCVALQLFSVQGNHFRSSIPSLYFGLKSIQFLDLSSNNLFGEIPSGLAKLDSIRFLNLSVNALEGEVPNEGLFINTTAFSVEGNVKLCGGIKSLHLPECPKERLYPQKKKKRLRRIHVFIKKHMLTKKQMVLIFPAVCILVVMFVAYVYVCYKWSRIGRNESIIEPLSSPLGDQYPKLSYSELLEATDGFSPNTLIASGRYSSVYKGILKNSEQTFAVKVINLHQSGARKSFLAECEAFRSIRHRNLVKIITACSGTDFNGNEFKALVYEFMSNGDLDSWLHPVTPKNLDLLQRLNIAIDIASVLVYLHHGCELPVIHRDIKPSNILLDNELCAHLGDFGSARSLLHPIDKTTHIRIRSSAIGIVGTVGYVALECGMGGRVSTLVDVYSYGILLLEMFTGKRPTDIMFKDDFSLRNYVKMAIPGRVMSVADPWLLDDLENNSHSTTRDMGRNMNFSTMNKCLASIFQIGVTCSAHLVKERMEIKDALMQLRSVRDVLLNGDEI